MGEATAAEVTAAAKLEAENRETAMELKLQRRWREDVQNAYRGQVSDILSHVEGRLPNLVDKLVRPILDDARASSSANRNATTDALNAHQTRVAETIAAAQKNLENEIASIVVRELTERQIIDADGNLNHHMVSFAISKINGK